MIFVFFYRKDAEVAEGFKIIFPLPLTPLVAGHGRRQRKSAIIYLLNFNVFLMKDGIIRIVNKLEE